MTTVAPITTTAGRARERRLPAYLLAGVAFGIVLTKGELVSWFRIQEALRFKGLYLYEVFASARSEEHTSELQSLTNLVCRLLLEKKNFKATPRHSVLRR